MNEERLRVLNMLAEGKLTAAEAASLLDALGGNKPAEPGAPAPQPRYLRVVVDGHDGQEGGRVNLRVPMSLIRAGVRLAALLPPGVHDEINREMKKHGLDIDLSKVRPENLEEIVEHLGELTVDVEGHRGEKVRVFCE